jgi:hypothetical protein
MLAHQGDTAQVMVLADGLIALGDIFGRAQQQEVAMLENVLLVWRNVAAFAFAHAASVKKWKADVPQKMLTSSIAMCPTVEKPRPGKLLPVLLSPLTNGRSCASFVPMNPNQPSANLGQPRDRWESQLSCFLVWVMLAAGSGLALAQNAPAQLRQSLFLQPSDTATSPTEADQALESLIQEHAAPWVMANLPSASRPTAAPLAKRCLPILSNMFRISPATAGNCPFTRTWEPTTKSRLAGVARCRT